MAGSVLRLCAAASVVTLLGATGGCAPATESENVTSPASVTPREAASTTAPLPAAGSAPPLSYPKPGSNPPVVTTRTSTAAVQFFSAAVRWYLAQPSAARAKAAIAISVTGAKKEQLAPMGVALADVTALEASGWYRILAVNGAESSPTAVMLEIRATGTLASAGSTPRVVLGGVVYFQDGRWRIGTAQRPVPNGDTSPYSQAPWGQLRQG
ncbi:hypothetical protein ACMYYO_10900 [Dermacoccaceae bacterium W4C1]